MTTKTYDGQTARLIASVATCMPPLSGEVMQGWIDNPQALKNFLGGLNPSVETKSIDTDVFRLTVDYGQSLEQMIATGQYDWKNSDITAKRFPIDGKGIVELEARYFHFDRNISSEDVIEEMKKAGFEPAKIEHVLSHGKTFPEEQRKFPIIGLGSVARVDVYRYVPVLYEDGSSRSLYLYCFDDDWDADSRFLAVRKVSGA